MSTVSKSGATKGDSEVKAPVRVSAGFSTPKKKVIPKDRPKASDIMKSPTKGKAFGEGMIVDVWANNLREEIGKIQEIVDDYNYIAMVSTGRAWLLWQGLHPLALAGGFVAKPFGTSLMQDTEFPGVVARPIGSFKNSHDYHYQVRARCAS